MTGPRHAAAPGVGTEGGAETVSIDGDGSNPTPEVKLPTPDAQPDWAAALTCPYACGLRHCPWECLAVWGAK